MTQDPPAQRRHQSVQRPAAAVQRSAATSKSSKTPVKVTAPAPKPTHMTTSSIVRPQRVVPGKTGDWFYTSERVNMRATASTSAPVVDTLKAGEAVKLIVRDGKWRLVSFQGKKGWIHGDYLGAKERQSGSTPRPREDVVKTSVLSPLKRLLSGGRKPSRAPQAGDCQCPYDLMIDGSQCGDRSAYSRRSRKNVQCYL
ncbi:SH3 domain-containing protein [Pseudaminobacter sp. NGMCC 1.201702]|uniref:SH3 domain-containing protein n=1 Tax=Pseudaminobacter sp. NGMCC 1.201702 TaxID=3391825 RepID=UPI0039EF8806